MKDANFLATDGVRLHYVTGGAGVPLVLLTGYSGNTKDFAASYDALSEQHTVICMDYRGHGESDVPASGWHIERLAKDLYELLSYLGVDSFYLLGHSMGNTVAWCFMELFGQERIRGYVLYEESPCLLANPAWTEAEQNRYLGKFRIPDVWSFPSLPPDGGEIDPRREAYLSNLVREHLTRDWRDAVESIRIPTLILMGEGSHFGAPELWDYLHDSIPGSRLEVIPAAQGGTHMFHREDPERFRKLVLDYFYEVQRDGK